MQQRRCFGEERTSVEAQQQGRPWAAVHASCHDTNVVNASCHDGNAGAAWSCSNARLTDLLVLHALRCARGGTKLSEGEVAPRPRCPLRLLIDKSRSAPDVLCALCAFSRTSLAAPPLSSTPALAPTISPSTQHSSRGTVLSSAPAQARCSHDDP
eukprot:259375-Chlamydomonas_euryale.AAC.2